MATGIITAVDRVAGTITVDSLDAFMKVHYPEDGIRSLLADDSVFLDAIRKAPADGYEFRMSAYPQFQVSAPGYAGRIVLDDGPNALAAGIAATCAIAGLGLLIARRNAVMAAEGPSEPWLKAFIEWACEFVRALFSQRPALPAHKEANAA